MRRSSRLVLLAGLLLSAGCSWFGWLPWVGDGKDEKKDGPAELQPFDAEVNVKSIWSASIGDGLGKKYLKLAPAVLADQVFAADAYGDVEARDRFKGKRLWKVSIGKPDKDSFFDVTSKRDPSFVMGGVGAGEGVVLIGTARAEVIALSAVDGSERWRAHVSSEVVSAPVASGGLAFAQTSDGRLVGLDVETGAQKWSFDNQVPVLTLRGAGSPVVDGSLVFAGFPTGKVHAFRAATGEPVWEQRVMLPQGRSELERIVDVDGTPVVNGSVLYAASYQGRLKALRVIDGNALWERDISSYLDLAAGYGQVYVVDDQDVIRAFDQNTSEQAWEQRAFYKRGLSSPIVYSSYVIVTDAEGFMHVLAQSDGRILGRRKIDGDGVRSRGVAMEDLIYCLGNDGKLSAVAIEQRG
jgi:outer membrane protein assembly factor BamB